MNKKIQQFLFFLAGLVVSIGFDQWTKYLAVVKLKGKQPFVIWDGVFELYYSENRGAAFGMMQGKQGFFFLIAIAVIAVVVFLLFRMPSDKNICRLPDVCSCSSPAPQAICSTGWRTAMWWIFYISN